MIVGGCCRYRLPQSLGQTFRTFLQCSATLNKKDPPRDAFYDKYKEKLEQAQGPLSDSTNEVHHMPHSYTEQYGSKPSASFYKHPTLTQLTMELKSVLKLDLVETRTANEITNIWAEYHGNKDCISAVMTSSQFLQLQTKATHCPMFVYPLPRDEGYETWFSQYLGQRSYFTSLINYKRYKENAPVSFTLTYYTELMKSKEIVLVHGEVDTIALTVLEAQNLTNQVQLYYGSEHQPELYALLHNFNHKHEDFDYQVLLDHQQCHPTR